jgi:hypothetical protein
MLSMVPIDGETRAGGESTQVAVLPVEFLKADYFPDADVISPDERRRLDMVAGMIRERLSREGFDVATRSDTEAGVARADPGTRLHECNGCELDIGLALGADWVMVSWVQMVSNLILNLNVVVYEVSSGARVAQAFVDLRGNNERSWRRATTYLLDRILVARMNDARQGNSE